MNPKRILFSNDERIVIEDQRVSVTRPSDGDWNLRIDRLKINFLFVNQNICCGYSKEPSQWDGSIEYPKRMWKLMDKELFTILR